MKNLILNPFKSGKKMSIVCFISGSGTNYREIVNRDPNHDYLVFTNRPGCSGTAIARENKHEIIELSHIPYLKEAKRRYSSVAMPRNCPERLEFEQDACRLIETKLGKEPDLICLAGYDQWLTDWTVERYYPHMLNVHPGDTTQGYEGLHWIPAAKAILAGDKTLRSTVFVVDKGEDTGPVLMQSVPFDIYEMLTVLESRGIPDLHWGLNQITDFVSTNDTKTLKDFSIKAGKELRNTLELICRNLQDALKVAGDWKIYPFVVHDMVARGRVEVDGRKIFLDGELLPDYGYRPDEDRC
jgi:phosphoribosylglycinamide formyltransferase 1